MRILFISHCHPAFIKGGAQLAAWRLFQICKNHYGSAQAQFLTAAPDASFIPNGSEMSNFDSGVWLIRPSINPLLHVTNAALRKDGIVHQGLSAFDPEIIHIHHFLRVGIDLILALRSWFPKASLVMTLHEYWGMCPNGGRLFLNTNELCGGPSPNSCVKCLGEDMRPLLAIRRLRIARLMDSIDHFIAPSFFLKTKYLSFGLSPKCISVVENSYPIVPNRINQVQDRRSDCTSLTFAYFGQVHPWKGVDLIISAFAKAVKTEPKIQLLIHGIDPSFKPSERASKVFIEYLESVKYLVDSLEDDRIKIKGFYKEEELESLYESVDVVVMASPWFENSPMVIQESFMFGCPVLVPNHGGMAEKVSDGVTGWHYLSGDIEDLSKKMIEIKQCPTILDSMSNRLRKMLEKAQHPANRHLKIYEKLVVSNN